MYPPPPYRQSKLCTEYDDERRAFRSSELSTLQKNDMQNYTTGRDTAGQWMLTCNACRYDWIAFRITKIATFNAQKRLSTRNNTTDSIESKKARLVHPNNICHWYLTSSLPHVMSHPLSLILYVSSRTHHERSITVSPGLPRLYLK